MTAAFVQPNDPAVERLLKQTAELLRLSEKSSALDGYEGGAKRVWQLASAVWGAVARMKLDYALPPASFEQTGQKVRSPSQIADTGLATCMDLTLLFCAAVEQIGLNPVIVFGSGTDSLVQSAWRSTPMRMRRVTGQKPFVAINSNALHDSANCCLRGSFGSAVK